MKKPIKDYLMGKALSENQTTRYSALLMLTAADRAEVERLKKMDWKTVQENLRIRRNKRHAGSQNAKGMTS